MNVNCTIPSPRTSPGSTCLLAPLTLLIQFVFLPPSCPRPPIFALPPILDRSFPTLHFSSVPDPYRYQNKIKNTYQYLIEAFSRLRLFSHSFPHYYTPLPTSKTHFKSVKSQRLHLSNTQSHSHIFTPYLRNPSIKTLSSNSIHIINLTTKATLHNGLLKSLSIRASPRRHVHDGIGNDRSLRNRKTLVNWVPYGWTE
ncbi:hypothetical protein FPQ18DRAFT_416853 [Pyronema domesticum]|nr:hypothetical protein FPQ18DRAFT_416853 [Pyronema domesticum]